MDNYLRLVIRLLNHGISVDVISECNWVEMVTYVFEKCENCGSNLVQVDFYISCLEEMSSCNMFVLDQNLCVSINEWLPRISRDLSLYHCAMLTQWVCELSSRDKAQLYSESWRCVIDLKIHDLVNTYKEKSFILDRSKNPVIEDCSVAVSNYVNTFWDLLGWYTKTKHEYLHVHFDTTIILKLIFEALQLVRNENLASFFRALESIYKNNVVLSDEDSVCKVIDGSWKRLEEIQATPYYQSAVYEWISAFIQLSVLRCNAYQRKVQYVSKFLLH